MQLNMPSVILNHSTIPRRQLLILLLKIILLNICWLQDTFYEPTEMTILPNLDILIIQRRGEIMLYKQTTGTVKQAGFLNVYFKSKLKGVNVEEGMLGLSKDPDFKNNHWVYIYYSPADSSVNRLVALYISKMIPYSTLLKK